MASHRKYCAISKHSMLNILEVQDFHICFHSYHKLHEYISKSNGNQMGAFHQKGGNILKKKIIIFPTALFVRHLGYLMSVSLQYY